MDEDWALLDSVPAYSVSGGGSKTATFWSALCAATPALASRTPAECEARVNELKATGGAAKLAFGPQPPVLEAWTMLPDGRYTGTLSGRTAWLTAATAGRLADDPRETQPGFIEAVGGAVYELGNPAPAAPPAVDAVASGATPANMDMRTNPMPTSVLLGAVAVLTGALGFTFGSASVSPPPAPPAPAPRETRIFITQPRYAPVKAEGGASASKAGMPSSTAPLTVSEQRERAELRVERDKARLKMLELRLREDESRLSELRRIEADRGPGAEAVKLVFPPDAGPK